MKIAKKPRFITKEEIMKKISEYDIYRYYFGEFQVNKKYLNRLRGDKSHPSFSISTKHGDGLYHVDFASDYWRGNCFNLVQQIFRCDYQTALRQIDKDFGLGLSDPSTYKEVSPIIWEPPKVIKERKSTIIQVKTRGFYSEELEYWNGYSIDLQDLRGNDEVSVHAIDTLYLNGEKIHVKNDLVFGYLFHQKYWKIYRPFSKSQKWMTNCPLTEMYGLSNIQDCDKSIITKSVKDYLVCKKFLTDCTCGVQNESTIAISDENIEYIIENSKERYVIFDNEEVGVESCKFYNDKGFGYWNVPKKYYERHGIKDPSDLVHWYGPERLISEFKKKIIL